ncbi:RNB domain-containing ribonuclease [Patulibacter defluvii]|uniref:RNB domain-containing ribonuclease n=1 Tax=Patulibacter defluvii TaxID=3095358 RepID=UPI002A748B25|nr:RNB domain-containing ribonuclease [Patulibacter sp. DM4]
MRLRPPLLTADDARVRAGLDRLRAELEVPDGFPADALATAERAAATPPEALPEGVPGPRVDRTDVELVTVDPEGSTDLDQALAVTAREGGGFRVAYAIADLALFVPPAGPLDAEVHRRGVTHYAPDGRSPLHPDPIGTGAASLLPDGVRPAVLWTVDLDPEGAAVATTVERAVVRSRRQLSYEQAQALIDGGDPPLALSALRQVGELRLAQERARGGISLTHPQQEVVPRDGGYALRYAAPLAVEDWNAQISLLCGIEAARIMLDGGVGLLRTLPDPEPRALERLRRSAAALGVDWPAGRSYPEFVRGLDPATAVGGALLTQCARTLRGAGYTAFDGSPPAVPGHAAIAAPYAHVTAPIRRLADRVANEALLAQAAGRPVPPWVRAGLTPAAEAMAASGRRAGALERGAIDLVEALLLADRVGEAFTGVVVDVDDRGALVQLRDPAVQGRATGDGLELGRELRVTVAEADPERRVVRFAAAGPG